MFYIPPDHISSPNNFLFSLFRQHKGILKAWFQNYFTRNQNPWRVEEYMPLQICQLFWAVHTWKMANTGRGFLWTLLIWLRTEGTNYYESLSGSFINQEGLTLAMGEETNSWQHTQIHFVTNYQTSHLISQLRTQTRKIFFSSTPQTILVI